MHFSDGDEVAISFSVPLGDQTLEFSGLAMVVEVDSDKHELECKFLDIEMSARSVIERRQ